MGWHHHASCKQSESGERQLAKLLCSGAGLSCRGNAAHFLGK